MSGNPHSGLVSIQSSGIKINYSFPKNPENPVNYYGSVPKTNSEATPAPKTMMDVIYRIM